VRVNSRRAPEVHAHKNGRARPAKPQLPGPGAVGGCAREPVPASRRFTRTGPRPEGAETPSSDCESVAEERPQRRLGHSYSPCVIQEMVEECCPRYIIPGSTVLQ
jgi:hypothetical protein